MSRVNCVCCWLWLLTVMWVIYVGDVTVLVVVLCWWWCCAGDGAGRLGFLGRPKSLTVTLLYYVLFVGVLTPPYMHLVIEQLVSWLACPARLVPGWYFVVTHIDKLDSLMIINSTSFKFYCHLYYCRGGISLCIFYCLQVIKNNREERKERKKERNKKSCSLGYLDSFMYFVFISFYFWLKVVTFYLCHYTCNILLFSGFCKDNVYCAANQ
jgi:hypothetical protein